MKYQLYSEDCYDVLPTLPALSIDVVVTSPPYNLNLAYSSFIDRMTSTDYIFNLMRLLHELRRVLKDDGSVFLNLAGSPDNPYLPHLLIAKLYNLRILEIQNVIYWIKSISINETTYGHFKPINSERFINSNCEFILHLTKTGKVSLDRKAVGVPYMDKSNLKRRGHTSDLRCRGNTWFIPYPTVRAKSEKFDHPAIYLIAVPDWCIRLHGKPKATVLDPFSGVGTTLVAAAQLGCREAIGIDLSKRYTQTALNRLKAFEK